MNTGGGATKINNVGEGITYLKKMPPMPDFFRFLQGESDESWAEMYRGFNCGVGLDIVGRDTPHFQDALQRVSERTGVRLYELGQCRENEGSRNQVILETPQGTFNY